jgi:hypothetical protein
MNVQENNVKAQLDAMFRATLQHLDIGARMATSIHCQRDILTLGDDCARQVMSVEVVDESRNPD